jgi:hypothetical protein
MTITSKIPQYLLYSYHSAEFHVHANPSFILKVGQYSHDLNWLYESTNTKSAAFITAYNPYSQELNKEENISRNRALESQIETLNLKYFHGVGKDPEDDWDGELSFLILNLDQDSASVIGNQFEQNAIVWCSDNAIPQLILLR